MLIISWWYVARRNCALILKVKGMQLKCYYATIRVRAVVYLCKGFKIFWHFKTTCRVKEPSPYHIYEEHADYVKIQNKVSGIWKWCVARKKTSPLSQRSISHVQFRWLFACTRVQTVILLICNNLFDTRVRHIKTTCCAKNHAPIVNVKVARGG